MEPESVDAIVTDPPYGVNLSKETCPWDTWPGPEPWVEMYRVLKGPGRLAFFIAPRRAHICVPDVVAAGFQVLEVGCWICGVGRPVHKTRLKRCWTAVYFCGKETRGLFPEQARGAYRAVFDLEPRRKGSLKRIPGKLMSRAYGGGKISAYLVDGRHYWPADVACEVGLDFPDKPQYEKIFAVKRVNPSPGTIKDHHITEKPLDLVAQIVRLVSKPGDLVVDPFCGGGSTGEACQRLGRDFVGIELSEAYCEMARRRLAQPMSVELL